MTAAASTPTRPWLISARSEILERGLPEPDPDWLLRCRNAGITVTEAVAAHEDRVQGRAGPQARVHAAFPKRFDGYGSWRTAILECSCGARAEARNFSRGEESTWRAEHLEQARPQRS